MSLTYSDPLATLGYRHIRVSQDTPFLPDGFGTPQNSPLDFMCSGVFPKIPKCIYETVHSTTPMVCVCPNDLDWMALLWAQVCLFGLLPRDHPIFASYPDQNSPSALRATKASKKDPQPFFTPPPPSVTLKKGYPSSPSLGL